MLRQILFVVLATCLLFRGNIGASVTCEGKKTNLVCGPGQVISVQSAVYGRRDTKICSSGRKWSEISNVNCARCSTKVAQMCDGKRTCSFTANNALFGDPCGHTYKYLEVDYSCRGASVTCEGKKTNLACGPGQVMTVQSAVYGRRDTKTCSSGRKWSEISNVNCARSSTKVPQMCDGKRTCSFTANNALFGDPCGHTYKYLEVDYSCRGASVTCEGQEADLACSFGQVITVHSAIYGRRDTKTCSRPGSRFSNVNCARSSTKQVAKTCNGRCSCSFTANNAMFGDPCRGTYKYLTVVYSCD